MSSGFSIMYLGILSPLIWIKTLSSGIEETSAHGLENGLTVHRVRLLRRHNEKMGFKGCLGTFTRRWHLQTSGISSKPRRSQVIVTGKALSDLRYTAVFY